MGILQVLKFAPTCLKNMVVGGLATYSCAYEHVNVCERVCISAWDLLQFGINNQVNEWMNEWLWQEFPQSKCNVCIFKHADNWRGLICNMNKHNWLNSTCNSDVAMYDDIIQVE